MASDPAVPVTLTGGPEYGISVVIPTYQRRSALERALRGLAQQSLAADGYEVIVAIDGSDDGTHEMLASISTPYRLRWLRQPNRGRAAACNGGIAAARGSIVVILDDDMEPFPGLLETHQRLHLAGTRLGVVGAVPVVMDPPCTPVTEYIAEKFNRHLAMLATPGFQFKLRDFYSGNFSIRREHLLAVGGFDEAFAIYGNEDLELSLRLVRAGVQLVYNPEAGARQHYTKTFSELARDNVAKGRTAVLLARLHPETFDDLKLSTYGLGSRKWRWLRAALLHLADWWPGAPDQVSRFMEWLQQRRPAHLQKYIGLSLDYFYWVGARAAEREARLREDPSGRVAE